MIDDPNGPVMELAAASSSNVHEHERDYHALLAGLRASFDAAASRGSPLFLTDADGLSELYLDSLPAERQVHNCSCCRRFIRTYGGLVAITESGETVPAMWNPESVPEFYRTTVSELHARVKRARVTSVFLTKLATWGSPVTGSWTHLAVTPPSALLHRGPVSTAGQAMASAKENFRIVATALSHFTPPMLDEALRLLQADALARSEKFVGPVKWLRGLHDRPNGIRGENLLWRATATAPAGYCHPRASVIGPLLEDIAAGLPFAEIKARFDAKMHPLQYQRPQVAPSAGNIAAAEAIVAKMGIAPALERRFARLDELHTTWMPLRPRDDRAPASGISASIGGIFRHLKPKQASAVRQVDMPAVTITWEKFARTALPGAERMEILVPSNGRFIALTAAVNADAPPILKWDREERRNPFAWYVYPNGSPAQQWGLTAGAWATINGVVPLPTLWGDKPMPYVSEGVVLVVDGAADTNAKSGNALFPEYMRQELHGVRATIEAYSRSATLFGRKEASACGYDIRKGSADCSLRVFANGAWTAYSIDRWD